MRAWWPLNKLEREVRIIFLMILIIHIFEKRSEMGQVTITACTWIFFSIYHIIISTYQCTMEEVVLYGWMDGLECILIFQRTEFKCQYQCLVQEQLSVRAMTFLELSVQLRGQLNVLAWVRCPRQLICKPAQPGCLEYLAKSHKIINYCSKPKKFSVAFME